MELNFNNQVIGLNGQPLEGEQNSINKILANILAYSSSGPLTKFMDWARDLYAGKVLNLDRTDAEVLEGFIKSLDTIPNITKEQMLEVIAEARVQPIAKNKK